MGVGSLGGADRQYLVLDLPPGQLTNGKLHQHVEERPQVIMATHLLQVVGDSGGGQYIFGNAKSLLELTSIIQPQY